MPKEALLPSVQGTERDLVSGADFADSDATGAFQIVFQGAKHKAQRKGAEGDEEVCEDCMAIIAERAVEDRDHHETVYDFPFPFIGDAAAVSAVGHHAPTAAAAMAYKCPGRYIFEGGLDPLPLIKFWPYWQDEFWEVVFSIHRLFLSLPYQEAATF